MTKKFKATEDPFYNLEQVVSSTECTGLIPKGCSDEDAENYSELYSIHSQHKKNK